MTTMMTTKGHVAIPLEFRERKNLRPGDEVEIEERAEGILIRKKRRNAGLVDLLLACPVKGLKIPKLRKEYPKPIKF